MGKRMLEQLKNAAEHISQMNAKTREEAIRIRNSEIMVKEALEKELVKPVRKGKINGKIAAVDGGILAQEMHGVDLIIARGASVIFEYKDSKLKNTEYYPEPFPSPEYTVEIGLDEHEINAFRSLYRLGIELNTALETIEKFNPEVIILDGSLVPLSSDRPQEGSEVFAKYREIILDYKRLYSKCGGKNCLLLGIIKDSRGRRFMDSIKGFTSMKSSDTVFLNHLLKEKERTSALRMSNDPKKNLILRDLEGWNEKLNLFYLKSVEGDRPMRIEFLNNNRDFNEIASLVYSLSAINQNYAYPAVLIEADLRAMLDPKEMERMQKTLQMFSTSDLLPLRRNSRPFR